MPDRLLPEETRYTAYYYASQKGLPVTFGFLLEFGLRAARLARWHGLRQALTWEGAGPPGTTPGFWVHTWPAWIWDEAARPAAPCPVGPPPLASQVVNQSSRYAAPLTRVVNLHHEPCDVNIMRPGPWGNPFVIGRDGDRAEVIAKYSAWIMRQPALMARLGELRGRVLGCCCKPEPCHGDVLAALADGRPPPQPARYRHSGDPAWESADGDPEGYGDPPGPRLTAWQYAEKTKMLTGEGDPAFVADLDYGAWYVGGRRGLDVQFIMVDGRAVNTWPESVWRDVADAMAQAGAERGETELGEFELDAVADGYLPDPEYRSRTGFRPTPAEFMQPGYGEPQDSGFWGYPAPPEDTQAYVDWMAMADADGNDGDIMWRDDPYVSAWHSRWPERDAGYSGPGGLPRDGDDIRPY
jgi:hypothetical protein